MRTRVLTYGELELQCGDRITRRCINGKLTSAGKCVGYCCYEEHEGFLTEPLRREHCCLEKCCFYYIPKEPGRIRLPKQRMPDHREILTAANEALASYEGIKALCVEREGKRGWVVRYAAVTNEYGEEEIREVVEKAMGAEVRVVRAEYDWDTLVMCVFGGRR